MNSKKKLVEKLAKEYKLIGYCQSKGVGIFCKTPSLTSKDAFIKNLCKASTWKTYLMVFHLGLRDLKMDVLQDTMQVVKLRAAREKPNCDVNFSLNLKLLLAQLG